MYMANVCHLCNLVADSLIAISAAVALISERNIAGSKDIFSFAGRARLVPRIGLGSSPQSRATARIRKAAIVITVTVIVWIRHIITTPQISIRYV